MKRTLRNRHRGSTVFVCGTSPHIHLLNPFWLRQGVVIGINTWYRYRPCHYWICGDFATKAWEQWGDNIYGIKAERFMVATDDPDVPKDLAHHWYTLDTTGVVTGFWNKSLQACRTTAIPAIHLAIIMGASEVVLWGVDIIGSERYDGTTNEYGPWEQRFGQVNRAIKNMANHVRIFKTNPKSPLEVPLWPTIR